MPGHMGMSMVQVSSATSVGTIGLAFLLMQPAANGGVAFANTAQAALQSGIPDPGRSPSKPPWFETDPTDTTAASVLGATAPPVRRWTEARLAAVLEQASALLDRMAAAGTLSSERVEMAREALKHLALWEVAAPTELSDGSDGDFTLIWRRAGLSASLTYTEHDVVGYAYSPQMMAPWMFEQERISIPELNMLARALG